MSTDPTISSAIGSVSEGHQRLWSPWRMRYVGGESTEAGCIFCNRLASQDDRRSLMLHRGDDAFIIMNLYPYNTGHSMIVPNQHTASPEEAEPSALAAMSRMRRPLLRALRRALNCQGFNLGTNIGAVAGAGIAEHLHEHVVPRWLGDANFMPILANTTVMPELIPVTYAKLRAELIRETSGTTEAACIVLATEQPFVFVDQQGRAPRIPLASGSPAWRTALEAVRTATAADVELRGWAGTQPAGDASIAFLFQAVRDGEQPPAPDAGWQWAPLSEALAQSNDPLLTTAALEPGHA